MFNFFKVQVLGGLVLLLVVLVAALSVASSANANTELGVDVSLGSIVGENISGTEVLPFWGQIEAGYDLGLVTPYLTYGHQSSADVNQGEEYQGEYYGIGLETNIRQFYITAQVVKFADSNFELETTPVQMYEVGLDSSVKGVPLRFGVWYENANGGFYEAAGLKLGYTFDLF